MFKGGTVSEFVARIHRLLADQKVDRPLNINVMPEQAATPIPPLMLQGVTFAEVAEFLRKSSTEQASRNVKAGRAAQAYGFKETGGIWYFVVGTEEGVGRSKIIPVNQRAAVYRVKAAADVDVVGVLEESFKSARRPFPRNLSYQSGSHAIVLRGTDEDHGIVLQAVQLMESDAKSTSEAENYRLEEEKRALAAKCAQLEKELQELKAQVKALRE